MSEITKIKKQIESLKNKLSIADAKADEFDKIKAKIEGYYKHNNQIFSNGLCEIVGEDIIKQFGYETNCL